MSFLNNIFGKKEEDPEILRLEELAKTNKDVPDPQVELALACIARVKTPPNWNDEYAKKAVKAFEKARAIAQKRAPSQTQPILNSFVETTHEVAMAYYAYYDLQPELKWLEASIWLLEQALSELTGQTISVDRIATMMGVKAEAVPDEKQQAQITLVRAGLHECWLSIAAWYETKLKDESEGEDCLRQLITGTDRAISYTDDANTRALLDEGIARNQIAVGVRYAERTRQSTVLGQQENNLLNLNDREHKEYARQSIRLLREGQKRLEKYPNSDGYAETLVATNDMLASAYTALHNLTWAHSKMSQSIGVLEEAVQVVPNNAGLWHSLGKAYEHLCDEVVEETNKRIESASSDSATIGPRIFLPRGMARNITISVGTSIAGGLAKKQGELKISGLTKKAAECYSKARQLAPDDY